ncbi:BatD family protein [Pedobacter metabolipauper]|nr:BatD family protein [Pedobacter metabolipauper]
MKQYFTWSWCLLLCLLMLGYRCTAQSIRVEAKLDRSAIVLGDQTTLRLNAFLPANGLVGFPALADTLSSKIQIVEAGKTDTIKDPKNPSLWLISRQYTITSFDAGVHAVPSLTFNYQGSTYATEALPLEVKSVAVDTTKSIYDIKQPLAVSYTFMDWLKDNWLLVVLAAVAILTIIAVWYYYKKIRKAKPVPQKVKEIVPPHVEALDKLNQLRSKKLLEQDEVKLYHIELTDIIREYLEKRYGIMALEQTSEEIFAALKQSAIGKEERGMLKQMLTLADLVKFAKAKPDLAENEQSMIYALNFVSKTKEITPLPGNKAQNNDELI